MKFLKIFSVSYYSWLQVRAISEGVNYIVDR